jgi:hypothetical protein
MAFIQGNIGKVIYNKVNSTVACFPATAPQGTSFPYLVYDILYNEPEHTKAGTPIDEITMLLSIYNTSYSACATNGNAVRDLLHRLKGTIESVKVDSCNFVTESDDYDNDLKCFIKIQEYKFRIKN